MAVGIPHTIIGRGIHGERHLAPGRGARRSATTELGVGVIDTGLQHRNGRAAPLLSSSTGCRLANQRQALAQDGIKRDVLVNFENFAACSQTFQRGNIAHAHCQHRQLIVGFKALKVLANNCSQHLFLDRTT